MLNKKIWMVAALVVGGLMACGGAADPAPVDDDCGDDRCANGETRQSCPEDCDQCGDGTCDVGETPQNCAVDCPVAPPCNHNNVCDPGETTQNCAADCPAPVCGDNICSATETATSCASDCGAKLRTQNNSSYTIYYLFVRRCTDSAWSTDQLSTSIPPGSAFTLTGIPPGCWYFKANDSGLVHTWLTPTGVTLQQAQEYPWTLIN